ncbi:MAG: hypothetical protein QM770_20540 [Tepidisphaeraceae bacterium]
MSDLTENLEALLAGYIDGSLNEAEQREADAFLDAHPEIREELQRAMLDSEYLRVLPRAQLPVDLSETVGARLEREMLLSDRGVPIAPEQRWGVPGMAVAAMVLMGIGIGVAAWKVLGDRPTLPPEYATNVAAKSETTQPARRARAGGCRRADAIGHGSAAGGCRRRLASRRPRRNDAGRTRHGRRIRGSGRRARAGPFDRPPGRGARRRV